MISRAQINALKDYDLRTILLSMYDQHLVIGGALGISLLSPTNSPQKPATVPPPFAAFTITGANGVFFIKITNAVQSINKQVYHELSYATASNFSSMVTILPVSTATHQNLPAPGLSVYWRLRSSYDQANWNAYQIQPGLVVAGFQS